jgi:hypothetical protein
MRIYEGKRCGKARICLVPEVQVETDFKALPEGMPIDYFDPTFFNRLQPNLRHRITSQVVALLPDTTQSFKGTPDETLSDGDFFAKYGSSVLSKYKLNDMQDEDGEWIEDDDADMSDDSVDDGDEMDEGDEEEEVLVNRNKIVQHLSMDMQV